MGVLSSMTISIETRKIFRVSGVTPTLNNKTFGRLFFTLAQSSEGTLLYSSLRALSRSIRLTFWGFTEWWTVTMTDLSTNRTAERTTSTTALQARLGLLGRWLDISTAGYETLLRIQRTRDGSLTSSQDGSTDLLLDLQTTSRKTLGILMMALSELNI